MAATRRGKTKVIYRGCSFHFHRANPTLGTSQWRCAGRNFCDSKLGLGPNNIVIRWVGHSKKCKEFMKQSLYY